MKIKRELKHATWIYDEDERTFRLETIHGHIVLDRVYAFSLARFLLRGIYRMTMKKKKVKDINQIESHGEMLESSSETSHSDDTL
jgi:hypothetical protein